MLPRAAGPFLANSHRRALTSRRARLALFSFTAFLFTAIASAPPEAFAKKDCAKKFAELREDSKKERKEFKRAAKEAREELGFKPEFESTGTKVTMLNPDGKVVGYFSFTISPRGTLHVSYMHVNKEYRKMGVSEALLGRALKEHPEVLAIEVDMLVETNEKVLLKALRDGDSCLEALMKTPAYLSRARFGFTEIFHHDRCSDGGFSVRRPKAATP